ncbi:MAG: phospholipid-binding lipoprotein MlaA [Moritella sp.]|jgi:phospholipid-binding lipoprotein MlaA
MIKKENCSNNFIHALHVRFIPLLFLIAGCTNTTDITQAGIPTSAANFQRSLIQNQQEVLAATYLSTDEQETETQDIVEELPDEEFLEDDDDLFADENLTPPAVETVVSDPFYYFNKAMFHFNDTLYFWLLRPTARGYEAITPQIVRTGVSNFFHNITTPIRFTSSVLQADIQGAGSELGRFLVNSTVGVLGLGDPAKHYLDWHANEQDLGLTLGKYGIGNGPYVVWPVFGPSTLRDSVGRTADSFLSPLTYIRPDKLSLTIQAIDKVNATYFSLGDYEAFKNAYIDPYERMKEFYIEYRASRIAE